VGEIRKQGLVNSVITYAGIIIGFLNIVVIQPNFLQPEELGLTRILFSFSVLIATILPLGIGNVTIKLVLSNIFGQENVIAKLRESFMPFLK